MSGLANMEHTKINKINPIYNFATYIINSSGLFYAILYSIITRYTNANYISARATPNIAEYSVQLEVGTLQKSIFSHTSSTNSKSPSNFFFFAHASATSKKNVNNSHKIFMLYYSGHFGYGLKLIYLLTGCIIVTKSNYNKRLLKTENRDIAKCSSTLL